MGDSWSSFISDKPEYQGPEGMERWLRECHARGPEDYEEEQATHLHEAVDRGVTVVLDNGNTWNGEIGQAVMLEIEDRGKSLFIEGELTREASDYLVVGGEFIFVNTIISITPQTTDADTMFEFAVKMEDVDAVKATHWYLLAAENGNPSAFNLIAERYCEGVGVEKDSKKAAFWYEKAAITNDDPKAMLALGNLYKNGDWLEKSDVKAAEWYHQAAVSEEDDFRCLSDTLANLGDCYYDGRGVQQDKELAADYYLESQLKYGNWIEGLKPSDDVALLKSMGNIRAKAGMFKTHSIQMKKLDAQNQKWRDERALADKDARKAETRKKVKEAGIGFGLWLFYGVVVLPILIFLITLINKSFT